MAWTTGFGSSVIGPDNPRGRRSGPALPGQPYVFDTNGGSVKLTAPGPGGITYGTVDTAYTAATASNPGVPLITGSTTVIATNSSEVTTTLSGNQVIAAWVTNPSSNPPVVFNDRLLTVERL